MNTSKSPGTNEPPKVIRLRPAILGDARALTAGGRQAILDLTGPKPARYARELLVTWLSIGGVVALGAWAQNIAVTILCIIFIGTRQSVLALLLHEQVHRLGMRSKFADWIINVCVVYPLFVTTVEDYAKVHLSHHAYLFTDKDPDFIRKSGQEWTFPKSLRELLVIAARDVTAMNVIRLIRGKTAPKTTEFARRNPTPLWLRIGFFASLAAVLTLVEGWTLFLVYWVIPLLTVAQLLIRWIAVAEHEYNVENGTILETTPIIELTWWQRLVFPDLNFGYHAYHHFHPGVSFSNLPRVHAIYAREGLVDPDAIFKGQGAYLRHLMGR